MDTIAELATEQDYDTARVAIEHYFDRAPVLGSAGAQRFDRLARQIAAYEAEHWPMDTAQ